MTPFALVMAYYDNPRMLREHVRTWLALPEEIAGVLDVCIVDDGSPRWPAVDAFNEHPQAAQFAIGRLRSLQFWRMGVDVRWNQDACRNVGAREARTRWMLLTDMDHVVPEKTWAYLMGTKLKKERAYRLTRVNAPNLEPYKPHPNTWVMTRDLYWAAGGYDEALAGRYGTDGDFKVRLGRVAPIQDLPVPVVRYPREVIADASTTTLERKSEADRRWINDTIKARGPNWQPLHFSFPCSRVL